MPLSLDNVIASTGLGLAGLSPLVPAVLFGTITAVMAFCGLQLGRAARAGDQAAAHRAEEERALAEVADLTAQAFDQEAIAAQEEAAARTAPDEPAATAARHRAEAARARAGVLRAQAEGVASEHPEEI